MNNQNYLFLFSKPTYISKKKKKRETSAMKFVHESQFFQCLGGSVLDSTAAQIQGTFLQLTNEG